MWLTLCSIAVLVALDQASKWWAVQVLRPVGTLPLLPGIVRFYYTLNDGAAFSIFAGRQALLIAVTSAALAVMLWLLLAKKTSNAWTKWGMTLIVAGGLGNLIDRVLNGLVVDFFDLQFMRYAVFNVADCFVTVGCVLLFIGILFAERMAKKRPASKTDAVSGPSSAAGCVKSAQAGEPEPEEPQPQEPQPENHD